jgi:hypothetical protein
MVRDGIGLLFLNSLTAIVVRERQRFYELRWRVVSPQSHCPLLAFDS